MWKTGNSRVFTHFNAGKRSIALDLTQPDAQQIAKQLIAQSDVLIENARRNGQIRSWLR